ncbi:Nucleolar protein 9 [Blyttiomyces sp. JEL0837]|nr:Nucleolar protein 9 [Blyttiomyces sp. JEL0837]
MSQMDENQPEFGAVPEDVLSYFNSIESQLDDPQFDSEEDMAMFVTNAFRELESYEVPLAGDPVCSRILEKLLRNASDVQLRNFTKNLAGMLPEESLIERFVVGLFCVMLSGTKVGEQMKYGVTDTEDDETTPSMQDLVTSVCEELKGQWSLLMTDAWGSYLVRTVFSIIRGEAVEHAPETIGKRQKSKKKAGGPKAPPRSLQVPESFSKLLTGISEEIVESLSDISIRIFATHSIANPVLQILVSVDGVKDSLFEKIFAMDSEESSDTFIGSLVRDRVGSHLLEKMMPAADDKTYQSVYTKYFRSHLKELAFDPVANFVVQALLGAARNQSQFQLMFEELSSSIEQLLISSRCGVVTKILEGCVKFETCQKEALKVLSTSFGVVSNEHKKLLCPAILALQTVEDYEKKQTVMKPDYHGAMILENLLHFTEENVKPVIESILGVSPEELTQWSSDAIASRVFESFLKSTTVPLKAKRKILHQLFGNYAKIAQDKYGSHIVDCCWAVAEIDLKEKIAKELLAAERELAASFHGKFVLRNCRIDQFKRGKDEWIQKEKSVKAKRDMFADILDDTPQQTKSNSVKDKASAKPILVTKHKAEPVSLTQDPEVSDILNALAKTKTKKRKSNEDSKETPKSRKKK